MKITSICILAVSLLSPVVAISAGAGNDATQSQAINDKGVATLKKALSRRLPSLVVDNVSTTPIAGLYQVIVGSQVVYMDANAKYMIDGDMVNLKTRKNYSEKAKAAMRLKAIAGLGEQNMLIYRPKKVDHIITVVTDVDCPYCRRLHSEMPEYMKNNIEVRYIFMPLKGESDRKKTESVWCAEDRHAAMNKVKAGGSIAEKTCVNPLNKQMQVANQLGVRGTPSIILEDGEMLPGYVPVNKLVAVLGKK